MEELKAAIFLTILVSHDQWTLKLEEILAMFQNTFQT